MTVNVNKAFEFPGVYSYTAEIPEEELRDLNGVEFSGAIPLDITVECKNGVVTMGYDAHTVYTLRCARCLKALTTEQDHHFDHILVREAGNNDDYITAEGGIVDMSEVALTDILLELPSKVLCREDCRGLCPKCGADLNEGDCGCDMTEI